MKMPGMYVVFGLAMLTAACHPENAQQSELRLWYEKPADKPPAR